MMAKTNYRKEHILGYGENETMIRKLVMQMLAAQILSALTVSLCLLIDNIMIGRYLGEGALTAYGLANPVLLVIGAVGSMLCAGVQVACGKSLGRGDQRETNAGYSSAIAVAAVFSLAFVALVVAFRLPLARVMGANEPTLLKDTGSYMAGFIIGAPASMGALILVPFLQMAGQSNLLIAAVLGMTVADVALDLLNVLVFHGGMFGMGLASSLSYYVAMVIGGGYFMKRSCVFKFSTKLVSRRKIAELVAGGVPTVISMVASVALIFTVNKLLLPLGGGLAVAAYTVINTIINASNCISTGSGGVALTLSGILFNEEDRSGLKELCGLMLRYGSLLGVFVAALLLIFAKPCVSLFIPNPGESQSMAIRGLRLFAVGLIPCCVNNVVKNLWQGAGRLGLMEIVSVLENAALPILSAFVLSRVAGLRGVWLLFLLGELLTTVFMLVHVWRSRGVTLNREALLLLDDSLGVRPEDGMERDIRDMDGLMAFSREADAFCRAHGETGRLANHLALCVEEMGGNIVTHGFAQGRGENHLFIRLQTKDGAWTLRFRDDCAAFDPISHISQANGPDDSMGIRLAMRIADDARYTYTMNLNNLTLVFRKRK